jgi:hypothetical protein
MSYKGIRYEGSIVGKPDIGQTAFGEITGDVLEPDFWPGITSGYARQSGRTR